MAKLSPETKKRITTVVNLAKTIFHIGFVPTVLYLGKELFCHAFYKVKASLTRSKMWLTHALADIGAKVTCAILCPVFSRALAKHSATNVVSLVCVYCKRKCADPPPQTTYPPPQNYT